MLKSIITTLVLLLSTLSAQAGLVTWTNFDILWNGTDTTGGIVTIQSQEGFGSFEAEVIDFSKSYYWPYGGSPPPIDHFLTPKEGSGMNSPSWLMFIDMIELLGEWSASFIGVGYDKYPGTPFTVTEFRGANWQIDDLRTVSVVPEPSTSMLLLMGLAGLMVFQKKRIAAKG